jgi:VanZ family protein
MGLANILRHIIKGLILLPSKRVRNLWRFLFFSALIFFTFLFLVPAPLLPDNALLNWWDKAQHALVFAVLMLLGGIVYPKKLILVLLTLILYGAMIEVLQGFTSWRNGDLLDWYADAVGALLAWAILIFLSKSTSRYSQS